VFDRLAVELADRENRKEPTKRSTGLLLQIIHCGVCGMPAYRLKGGVGGHPDTGVPVLRGESPAATSRYRWTTQTTR
jgi:hypothetical protein